MKLELPEYHHSDLKKLVMLHSISWLWQNYFEVFSGVPYQNRELIKLKLPYGTHNSAIDRPGNFFGFEYAGGGDGSSR